jgi:hypothetical protein
MKIHVACLSEGVGNLSTFENGDQLFQWLVDRRYIKETTQMKASNDDFGDDEDVNEEVSEKLVEQLSVWLEEGEDQEEVLKFSLVDELADAGVEDGLPDNVDLVFMWG